MRRLTILLLTACLPVMAQETAIVRYQDLSHPVLGPNGMVASQNIHATRVGAEILAAGGNAVDAGVAVGFALAVTLPRAGNLGGGGFMLIHDADTDTNTSIDYREMAPPRATRDMFVVEGTVDNMLARFSHLSAGVPGTVAGMWEAHQRFGKLPWKQVVEPAVRLASDGFPMSYDLGILLSARRKQLCQFDAACGYFYKADGSDYQPGEIFRQPDLAATLQAIADEGPDGFYKGWVARLMAEEMARHGGLVDEEAMASYKATWREPVTGNYRGYDIVTMAPPSSGGVHMIQMLNILENFDVRGMGYGSANAVHLLAESARFAYADRSEHLGDPDYYDVPVDWLTSKSYAKTLAARIDMDKATPSEEVAPGVAPKKESDDTTHFSVIDKDGNVVSNTYTLNFSFGSGIAVRGAGFLLNNEMDDFSAMPGSPNGFGLLGGEANSIVAGKRPLSSMTPTMVFADGEPWFATGSPGGSRIITTVMQMVVNVIDHQMNISSATNAPRMHHQWYPNVLQMESGFSPDTVQLLLEKGHDVNPARYTMGSIQAVAVKDGVFRGASDPRRPNSASIAP